MPSDPILAEQDLPSIMSFRELFARVNLGVIATVYLPYFVYVNLLFDRSPYRGGVLTGQSLGALVTAIVIQFFLTAASRKLLTMRCPAEIKDERDAYIEACSYRYAYGVLTALLLLIMILVPYDAVISSFTRGGHITNFAFMNQMMLLAYVLAEATKHSFRVIAYRRCG